MLLDGFGSNIFLLVSKKPCLCLFTWWEAHIVLLVPNKFVWLCLLSLFVTLYSIIQAYPELRKAKFGVLSVHTGVSPASLVYNLGSQHHQAENEDFAQNVVFPWACCFWCLETLSCTWGIKPCLVIVFSLIITLKLSRLFLLVSSRRLIAGMLKCWLPALQVPSAQNSLPRHRQSLNLHSVALFTQLAVSW